MMLAFIVYLASVLPKVGSFLGFISFASGMAVFAYTFLTSVVGEKWHLQGLKYLWITIVAGLLAALMPSERTMYMALGAYGVQTLAENDKVQALGTDGVDLLKEMMQRAKREMASDLQKEEKK